MYTSGVYYSVNANCLRPGRSRIMSNSRVQSGRVLGKDACIVRSRITSSRFAVCKGTFRPTEPLQPRSPQTPQISHLRRFHLPTQ